MVHQLRVLDAVDAAAALHRLCESHHGDRREHRDHLAVDARMDEPLRERHVRRRWMRRLTVEERAVDGAGDAHDRLERVRIHHIRRHLQRGELALENRRCDRLTRGEMRCDEPIRIMKGLVDGLMRP